MWPIAPETGEVHRVVFADGIYLARNVVVFIASTGKHVIGWYMARSKNSRAWSALMAPIPPPEVVVADGGSAAVSSEAESYLDSRFAERVFGPDAVDTSAEVVCWELKRGMEVLHMGVATARGWHDALSGAALCGKNNSVMAPCDSGETRCDRRCPRRRRGGFRIGVRRSCGDPFLDRVVRQIPLVDSGFWFFKSCAGGRPCWAAPVVRKVLSWLHRQCDAAGGCREGGKAGLLYRGSDERPVAALIGTGEPSGAFRL